MNQPLIPEWAERKLAEESSPSEVMLLRNFYRCWQDLHNIQHPHVRANKQRMEQAAQELVDAAMAVNAFYHPVILNG